MLRHELTVASALCATALWALPEIEDLAVTQDKGSRMVTISFTLTEKAIVTMDILTNGVSIGAANYQSIHDAQMDTTVFPANKIVAPGSKIWVWRPMVDWPGHVLKNGEFEVTVKAWDFDSPPDYMVLNSSSVSNKPAFYATAADLPGGIKTADPEDADAVAALKNDPYRTTKIVMRKIPAAGVNVEDGLAGG